jgi:hypothetical protein
MTIFRHRNAPVLGRSNIRPQSRFGIFFISHLSGLAASEDGRAPASVMITISKSLRLGISTLQPFNGRFSVGCIPKF